MLTLKQTQQLNQLLDTVNELTAGSISAWDQELAKEVQTVVAQIERATVAAHQASLVQQIAQTFDQQEQALSNPMELPLRALRHLVESGNLGETQKAQLLIQLGKTHDVLTQWEIALDQFYRALDYCQDDLPTKAEILKSIGHINSKQRDYRASNRLYRESLAIYSERQIPHQVAHIYICIGWNEFQSDNYPLAEANYHRALQIATPLEGAERLIADVNMNLAILATVRGEFETAISSYKQGVAAYLSIDDERGLAQSHYNMGLLYVDMQAWQQAGESYQKSLEYAQRQSNLHLIGHIHLSYTELALKLSDLALAHACCMHAVRSFGRMGSQSQLADAYKYAGQIQHRRRNWNNAERFFEKSIQLAQACESRLNQAEAHYEYGMMLMDKPDKDQAKTQLNEALHLFTALGAKVDTQNTQTALAQLA